MNKKQINARLKYLRGELDKECISQGELLELQELAPFIRNGDVQLLEAAGIPENAPHVWARTRKGVRKTVLKHRGIVIGENSEGCGVEGCRGTPYLVQWPKGEVTTCCTRGMIQRKNGDYQIQ